MHSGLFFFIQLLGGLSWFNLFMGCHGNNLNKSNLKASRDRNRRDFFVLISPFELFSAAIMVVYNLDKLD